MGEYNKVESLVHLHIHYATVYWVVIEYQLIEERERSRMKVNNVTFLIFFSRCISSILYHQSLTTAILVSEIFYFCLLQIRALCINVVSNCPHGVMKNTHIKWSVPWFFFFYDNQQFHNYSCLFGLTHFNTVQCLYGFIFSPSVYLTL